MKRGYRVSIREPFPCDLNDRIAALHATAISSLGGKCVLETLDEPINNAGMPGETAKWNATIRRRYPLQKKMNKSAQTNPGCVGQNDSDP